jgi:hypothetical protein
MAPEIPQELWDNVATYLPPISAHNASKAFGFKLTERQIEEFKYENVWHSIFAKDTWLRRISDTRYAPTLIGHDLHKLYYYDKYGEGKVRRDVICHLVITIAPNIRLLEPDEYKLFFECLRPHTRNGDEITIRKGDDNPLIILNINDFGRGDGSKKGSEIIVPFLPWLFNRSLTRLQSAYILWQGTERTLKTIESDRIIGVGTYKTHESASFVCWLWLQDNWVEEEKWVVQLQVPGEYHVKPKGGDGISTIYTLLEHRLLNG